LGFGIPLVGSFSWALLLRALSGQVKSGQWWSGKIRPTDFPEIWGFFLTFLVVLKQDLLPFSAEGNHSG
jgi:hypothetical protein